MATNGRRLDILFEKDAMAISVKEHITSTPDILGGKPCIAGTRIRVQDIYVWHELQGHSPDEIVQGYPQLMLADVYAALAYLWDHREAILAEIHQGDQIVEQLKLKFPSKLRDKLMGGNDANSISS
ncbi:MAG TPA: DUF433 domain-containing protein [Tepidisphaeraceae bacterium]|nr:DUF433 domain-containing protein [Tepidisphaeraceae bacterium]